jgi:hypothetical protein
MAMGAFILLSSDLRIGIKGDYNFAANEVAIEIDCKTWRARF